MFSYVIKNYIGIVVGMKDGFYSVEECRNDARKTLIMNGGTQGVIYEDGSFVELIRD